MTQLANFAVLKYEQGYSRDKQTFYGGIVDGTTLGDADRRTFSKPRVQIVTDVIPDQDEGDIGSWGQSNKRDIRREFSETTLFEGNVTGSTFSSMRYGLHDGSPTTYNTQVDFAHLMLLQQCHDVTTAQWSILAIDIEASGHDSFPDADIDPVLQISLVFQPRNGDASMTTASVLGLAGSVSGASSKASSKASSEAFTYEEFEHEVDLLQRFAELIRNLDPDLITGWNVLNFDWAYILDRAFINRIRLQIGRDGSCPRRWDKETITRAHGTRITKMCDVHGRIVFDACGAFQKILNEPSYKLQSMSVKYLGSGKDDMPYNEILPSMNSLDGRLRVARYCYKDSLLVLELMQHFKLIYRFAGIVGVTGAPLTKVIHGGQQIRCFSALLKEIFKSDLPFAFPNLDGEAVGSYQGATVLKPHVGATQGVIATLDFAALYPNVMRAYNMCWSTLCTCDEAVVPYPIGKTCPYTHVEQAGGHTIRRVLSIKDGLVQSFGSNVAFIQDEPGLIPTVQSKLYLDRKAVKAKMKLVEGLERDILDAYQLALKLVMNSMYGLLGAKKGYLPEVRIAAAITCEGRMLIEWTKLLVERRGLAVWGGDTDSVFVYSPRHDMGPSEYHSFWTGIADGITETYGHPALVLEYEKMYYSSPGCLSWILIAKKRYAGYKWDAGSSKPKVVYTGLECKRRDFCKHMQTTMVQLLTNLFTLGIQESFLALESTVVRMFTEGSTEGFILSKQYFKKADQYANAKSMPHVQVAIRTRASVGSRIPFFIKEPPIGASRRISLADRAVSLQEFEDQRANIDINFYFEAQFVKPLRRITDVVDQTLSKRTWFRIAESVGLTKRSRKRARDAQGFTQLFQPHKSKVNKATKTTKTTKASKATKPVKPAKPRLSNDFLIYAHEC